MEAMSIISAVQSQLAATPATPLTSAVFENLVKKVREDFTLPPFGEAEAKLVAASVEDALTVVNDLATRLTKAGDKFEAEVESSTPILTNKVRAPLEAAYKKLERGRATANAVKTIQTLVIDAYKTHTPADPKRRWEVPAVFSQVLAELLCSLARRSAADAGADGASPLDNLQLWVVDGDAAGAFGGLLELMSFGEPKRAEDSPVESALTDLSVLVTQYAGGQMSAGDFADALLAFLAAKCQAALLTCAGQAAHALEGVATTALNEIQAEVVDFNKVSRELETLHNCVHAIQWSVGTIVSALHIPVQVLTRSSKVLSAMANLSPISVLVGAKDAIVRSIDDAMKQLQSLVDSDFKASSTGTAERASVVALPADALGKAEKISSLLKLISVRLRGVFRHDGSIKMPLPDSIAKEITKRVEEAAQHADSIVSKLNQVTKGTSSGKFPEAVKALQELIPQVNTKLKIAVTEAFAKLEEALKKAASSVFELPQKVIQAQQAAASLSSHLHVASDALQRVLKSAQDVGKNITADIVPGLEFLQSSIKTLSAPESSGPKSTFSMLAPRKVDEKPDIKKKGADLQKKLEDLTDNLKGLMTSSSLASIVASNLKLSDLGIDKLFFMGLEELSRLLGTVKDVAKCSSERICH